MNNTCRQSCPTARCNASSTRHLRKRDSLPDHCPPEKNTCEKTSLQSAKSGAGEQFPPLDCKAKAGAKGMFCSQTPVEKKGWGVRVETLIELKFPNSSCSSLSSY